VLSIVGLYIIETYFYDTGRNQAKGNVDENNVEFSYILGNPPFVGKQMQNTRQKEDLDLVFNTSKTSGVLDYVTCWYKKTSVMIQDTKIKVGFVSTNSIAQGEQVGLLWKELFSKHTIKIHFAHRTFKWSNEAKGIAAVHCVIIGFANYDIDKKIIFEYEDIKGEPHEVQVRNISPYLVEGKDLIIEKRKQPICEVPPIVFGSMPNDGGNFLFTDEEKQEFLKKEPKAEKYIRPLLSAKEFLNGENRWCLWLVDIQPNELKQMKEVLDRVNAVKKLRNESTRESTKKLALTPTLFGENRQPNTDYILIPRVSSENRRYIPIGFFDKTYIVSDSCLYVSNAKLYHFGILTSLMHVAWIRHVCGRLESRFRYSNEIVYNNFPWPEKPTDKQKQSVEKFAQKVLDVRKEYSSSSLAELYDPLTMPSKLVKAHNDLDKAVDNCYRKQPFESESKRMEFLFALYEKYTKGLNFDTKAGKPLLGQRKSKKV
jgi:hypothetical protein